MAAGGGIPNLEKVLGEESASLLASAPKVFQDIEMSLEEAGKAAESAETVSHLLTAFEVSMALVDVGVEAGTKDKQGFIDAVDKATNVIITDTASSVAALLTDLALSPTVLASAGLGAPVAVITSYLAATSAGALAENVYENNWSGAMRYQAGVFYDNFINKP